MKRYLMAIAPPFGVYTLILAVSGLGSAYFTLLPLKTDALHFEALMKYTQWRALIMQFVLPSLFGWAGYRVGKCFDRNIIQAPTVGIAFFLFAIVAIASIQLVMPLVMSLMFVVMLDLPLNDMGTHNTMSMKSLSRLSTYISVVKVSAWVGIYSLIGAIAYRYNHRPRLVRGDQMSAANMEDG